MVLLLSTDRTDLVCDAYNDDPTRIARVAPRMPADDDIELAATFYKTVADPVRLRILFALSIEPLCVCELSTLFQISMPAVSYHLKLLTLTGIVRAKKEGKFASYSVLPGAGQGQVALLLEHMRSRVENQP